VVAVEAVEILPSARVVLVLHVSPQIALVVSLVGAFWTLKVLHSCRIMSLHVILKTVIYICCVVALCAFVWFWSILVVRSVMTLQACFSVEVPLTRLAAEGKRIIVEQQVLFKFTSSCESLSTLLTLVGLLVPLHVTLQRHFVLQEFLANFALQLRLCLMNSVHVFCQLLHFLAANLALLQLHSVVVHVMPKTIFCVKNFSVQIALELVDFSVFVLRLQVTEQLVFLYKLQSTKIALENVTVEVFCMYFLHVLGQITLC
jgi:hypothetical protein